MPPTRTEMSQAQLTQLASIIQERPGIHYTDGKKYILDSRLCHRLGELELNSSDQYIALLSMGPYRQDDFQEMSNRIMINETSFFRYNTPLDIPDYARSSRTGRGSGTDQADADPAGGLFDGRRAVHDHNLMYRTLGVRLADWNIAIR
jgi:chemotaxis protein methyltransferase CheR